MISCPLICFRDWYQASKVISFGGSFLQGRDAVSVPSARTPSGVRTADAPPFSTQIEQLGANG